MLRRIGERRAASPTSEGMMVYDGRCIKDIDYYEAGLRPSWLRPWSGWRWHEEGRSSAGLLKAQGYATGQFGKNHLGDKDDMLPTNHGFDEFYGNLYHLNAEEEPELHCEGLRFP